MFSMKHQGVFFYLSRETSEFVKVSLWRFSLNRRWALSLCSRSSREGSSFLFHEEKKRSKENSPSALFCLLRHFSALNKKNSLRSNSFLFLTLRKAPPLHGKKKRPECWINIASLVGVDVFFASLVDVGVFGWFVRIFGDLFVSLHMDMHWSIFLYRYDKNGI